LSRALSYTVFISIALAITAAVHYYIWVRLVRDAAWPPATSRALTIAIVALCVSIPGTLLLMGLAHPEHLKALYYAVYTWMGLVLFLLVLLTASGTVIQLATLVRRFVLNTPPLDLERRVALTRMLNVGIALAAGGLGTAALKSGLGRVAVKRLDYTLPRLPAGLDGLKLVQLSDVHVGPTIGRDFIEEVVSQTEALAPDIVVITGDLVDGSVAQLRDKVEPLTRLKPRFGVYFVTGNHEYYSGAVEWCEELTRMGIRVLRNEHVSVGTDDASFDLAGIDDHSARGFALGHGPDIHKAMQDRDPSRALVLLAHQPRQAFDADPYDVGLQLSGHTHGGQMWPWNYMVRLQQPLVSGLGVVGKTPVYVSNGTGYWGPPMRLGAPAEITAITLRSPSAAERRPA
jgi:predicted MPP superfamily phosphohydrolase